MEIAEHIAHLRRDGVSLFEAAGRAGLDAHVPSCPGWTVRDLVQHQGDVHRWAAAQLRRNTSEPMSRDERKSWLFSWEHADDLLAWFREGHEQLATTLEQSSDDVVAYTFLPAPNARAMWARRQSHETAIHRVDAELASGPPSGFDAEFAADGVDEILYGFASLPDGTTTDPVRSFSLRATDIDRRWNVQLAPDGVHVTDDGDAECTISATASDLYLLMWNRGALDGLELAGDPAPLSVWRESSPISWGGPSKK
ncbi:MAG: maleylpyruvate isomerase family mycothiol-dependent enzyme [Actinomycetes bacterium]